MNLYPKDKTALLVLLTVSAIALLVSYVLNIVMPVSWRWLSPDDLSDIKDTVISLLSGLVMATALIYFLTRR